MTELKRALTEIGERTPAYDVVDSALRAAGRRRRRRRGIGTAAVFAAVLAIGGGGLVLVKGMTPQPSATSRPPAAAAVSVPTRCEGEKLALPAGYSGSSVVSSGDRTGRYIVGQVYAQPGQVGVLWDGGVPAIVDLPGSDDALNDVNSAGTVVGSSVLDGRRVAWVVRDGVAKRLAGSNTSANAIDAQGRIAGRADGWPVVWTSPDAQPQRLAVPAGTTGGSAVGIGDDGFVVANLSRTGQRPTGFVWTSLTGTPTAVQLPDSDHGPGTGIFTARIRDGWVGGDASYGDTAQSALWNLRTGQAYLLDTVGNPTAVTSKGWLVAAGGAGLVLRTGDKVVDLPLPGERPTEGGGTDALSDDGRMVAGEYRNPAVDGSAEAMLWRCS